MRIVLTIVSSVAFSSFAQSLKKHQKLADEYFVEGLRRLRIFKPAQFCRIPAHIDQNLAWCERECQSLGFKTTVLADESNTCWQKNYKRHPRCWFTYKSANPWILRKGRSQSLSCCAQRMQEGRLSGNKLEQTTGKPGPKLEAICPICGGLDKFGESGQ